MQDLLNFLFNPEGFMPHGFCFHWQPVILWLTVFSDLFIFIAYFSIPLALGYFVYKRNDLEKKWIFTLFSVFIFACGATHLLALTNIWYPLYGLTAVLKFVTAVISTVTAGLLWPLIPIALKIPSPQQLSMVNNELKELNNSLDQLVAERTQQLQTVNEELITSQNRLQNIIDLSPSVIYSLKPSEDPISPFKVSFISERIDDVCGFKPQDWYQNDTLWIDHVHPQDSSRVIRNMEVLITQGRLEHEYQFQTKAGHYCWVRDELIIDYDEENNIREVLGCWNDITEYKQAEFELRLAATTFESMQAVMITDANANILRVNKAFTQITGFDAEDVIGQNPRIFKAGCQSYDFYQRFWEQLLREGYFEGEFWNRKESGEIYPAWQSITAVKDGYDQITHFVSVFSNISEKKEQEQEIKALAFFDSLTNLPNRRLLIDHIEHELNAVERHHLYGAIIFLDLDDFKLLNDSAGHLVGDEFLVQVSERIRHHLRSEDTPSRLGGDEFVVLLQANDSNAAIASEHAMKVAKKIQQELNRPYILNGTPMHFTSSIGISVYPDENLTAAELIQQADTAMYRSKSKGKNAISFFNREMQTHADQRIRIESQIRLALEESQFELYFQPQVCIEGNGHSAEALIRWNHPQRGLMTPAEFINIAEQSDLIVLIDNWVIKAACEQLKIWQQSNPCVDHIAVNISSRQLRQNKFVEKVEEILKKTGVRPELLMFEVTEGIFIDKVDQAVEVIKQLNKLGIRFSLDDFGTGYSSLSYLRTMPFQQLKIDREFIRDILVDKNDEAIVETIIAMANKLNLQVIAEGVETIEQFYILKLKGCLHYQGYYFSKPLSMTDFIHYFEGLDLECS